MGKFEQFYLGFLFYELITKHKKISADELDLSFKLIKN